MNKQSRGLCYFKSSFNLLCTNQLIISLLLVIEYLDIFSFLTTCIFKITHSTTKPFDNTTSFTYYISMYNLIKILPFNQIQLYTTSILIITVILFVWYYLHLFLIKHINVNNSLLQLYCKINVNFYDFIF